MGNAFTTAGRGMALGTPNLSRLSRGMRGGVITPKVMTRPGMQEGPVKKGMLGGLISQLVNGQVGPPPKKPNLQKAQRMNPPEVPTRRLY